jgi:hypothetical protein
MRHTPTTSIPMSALSHLKNKLVHVCVIRRSRTEEHASLPLGVTIKITIFNRMAQGKIYVIFNIEKYYKRRRTDCSQSLHAYYMQCSPIQMFAFDEEW